MEKQNRKNNLKGKGKSLKDNNNPRIPKEAKKAFNRYSFKKGYWILKEVYRFTDTQGSFWEKDIVIYRTKIKEDIIAVKAFLDLNNLNIYTGLLFGRVK